MKKIGFLFGKETAFSNSVMNKINSKNNPDIQALPVCIGILDTKTKPDYTVVFDRFSNAVPFYKAALKYFKQNGTIIVNDVDNNSLKEEFYCLTALQALKIKVPQTVIIPSKLLPDGVNGNEMQNLQYPLDWEKTFKTIGFPANVKSNNSNSFYDCFRIHNKQDFHFVYDMSGTNTLVLQECIDTENNYRIFVVGNQKMFLKYELNKAPKDRYSKTDFEPDKKTDDKINEIINTIKKHFSIDMFVLDIAVAKQLYVLNVSEFPMNIDSLVLPENCYEWLVEETANMLVEKALANGEQTKAVTKKTTTKKTNTKKATTKKATTKKIAKTETKATVTQKSTKPANETNTIETVIPAADGVHKTNKDIIESIKQEAISVYREITAADTGSDEISNKLVDESQNS